MPLWRVAPNREDTMNQLTFEFAGRQMTAASIGHLAEPDLMALFEHIGQTVAQRLKGRNVLAMSNWNAVLNYLKATMGQKPTETFRVLFLDKRNNLIADEEMQHGTVDHVPVYPREVLKRALELNATAMILTHNHPSGDPSPSSADITMTKAIMEAGKVFGITVHDHIVVGRDGHASMKALKLI
jgi:DNA repair protein RadC